MRERGKERGKEGDTVKNEKLCELQRKGIRIKEIESE